MAMSAINVQTVTEKYSWDIKVSPRSEFSVYQADTTKHGFTNRPFKISGMAFESGFMKDIQHASFDCFPKSSCSVDGKSIEVGFDIDVETTSDSTPSNTLVRLREVHLELISRGKTKFQTELRLNSDIQYKNLNDRKLCYKGVWTPTECWDNSIDNFRITFVISKQIGSCVSKIVNQSFTSATPLNQGVLGFKEFLFSDYLSDTIIVCGDKKFKAHRLILAGQSQVFDAMFRADMAETKSGCVKITDCEPEVVEQLLKYIYTRENPSESAVSEIVKDLFCVAHKYDVTGLKDFCESLLLKNLTLDNALQMCELAMIYSIDSLKALAFDVIKKNKEEWCGNAAKFKEITTKFPNIIYELFL